LVHRVTPPDFYTGFDQPARTNFFNLLPPHFACDGKTGALHVEPLSDPSCRKIVVHLGRGLTLSPRKTNDLTIDIGK
jgi:hypothetical protein